MLLVDTAHIKRPKMNAWQRKQNNELDYTDAEGWVVGQL